MIQSDRPNLVFNIYDVEAARKQGYEIAEKLYSEKIKKYKEEIKCLKKKKTHQ